MKYLYKAINEAGETVTGVFEAENKSALYKELKKSGNDLVTATEKRANFFTSANESFSAIFSRVNTQDKITFAKNLSAMIDAGLPMVRSLQVLERQTKNKKFAKIIATLNEDIRKGKNLSESMSAYPTVFSQLYISMVRSGEEGGSISGALKIVGDQMEKSLLLQKKIRGAMMYPVIILIVMSIIAVLMMIFVVPTLIDTFKQLNVELPWSTELIIFVSNIFIYHSLVLLCVVILIVAGIGSIMKTAIGKHFTDVLLLRIPVIGSLVKEINSARTARTLSSLLSSGVDMVISMEITEQVIQNSCFKKVINQARGVIQKGEAISGVFLQNQKLFPSFFGEMISVGEETGKLAPMLMEVAVFYENEVDQRTKDVSTIIEPVLMVIIGAAVGFFAISMLSPTYSVLSNIK